MRSAAAGRAQLEAKKVDALLLPAQDRLVFRANVDSKIAATAEERGPDDPQPAAARHRS